MSKDKYKPIIPLRERTFEEYDAGIISANVRTIIHKPTKKLWRQNTLIIEDCWKQKKPITSVSKGD